MPHLMTPKSRFPDLDLPLVDGGQFKTEDIDPKNFQIIVVYRGLHCPKCKPQLRDIDGLYGDVQSAGHNIIALSMDTEDRANQAKSDWGIDHLPIAYGLDIGEAKALGLFISDSISDKEPAHFAEPAIFVLRNDGALYAQIIQNTPFGRPNFQDLLNGLNYATDNDYPTRGTSVV